jgi:RNA polymerase sigma-70 factor (ECF subfamily)
VPAADDLPARVSGVLAVLFLVFNEGYLASGPDTDPVRHDLTAEAIRLTRLVRALMPEDGEVTGLLALMLLTEARRTARVSASGELVTLDEQDRGAWDAALVAEGHQLVRERLSPVPPGGPRLVPGPRSYQRRAHPPRAKSATPDWSQVVALYDQLVRLDPLPDRRAQPGRRGRRARRARRWPWQSSTVSGHVGRYHAYHATRATWLRRLGASQKVARRRTTEPSSWRATPPRPPT